MGCGFRYPWTDQLNNNLRYVRIIKDGLLSRDMLSASTNMDKCMASNLSFFVSLERSESI